MAATIDREASPVATRGVVRNVVGSLVNRSGFQMQVQATGRCWYYLNGNPSIGDGIQFAGWEIISFRTVTLGQVDNFDNYQGNVRVIWEGGVSPTDPSGQTCLVRLLDMETP